MTEIITGRSHQFSSFLLFILTSLTILHHIIITIIINYIIVLFNKQFITKSRQM